VDYGTGQAEEGYESESANHQTADGSESRVGAALAAGCAHSGSANPLSVAGMHMMGVAGEHEIQFKKYETIIFACADNGSFAGRGLQG
jgi:hypothetical protein